MASIFRRLEHAVHRVTTRVTHDVERDFNPKTGRLFSTLLPGGALVGLVPGMSLREDEHLGKRGLYYTNKEFAYVAGAIVTVVSMLGTPVLGGVAALALGEIARWQGYYIDRDISGMSAWQARQASRAEAVQVWIAGAAAAVLSGVTQMLSGAFSGSSVSASADLTAAGPSAESIAATDIAPSAYVALPTAEAPSIFGQVGGFITSPTAWQNAVGNAWNGFLDIFSTSPDVAGYDTEYLAGVEHESALLDVGGKGFAFSLADNVPAAPQASFLQSLASFKWVGSAWDYVVANPIQSLSALVGVGGTVATVGGQEGWFGKTGQAVAQDLSIGQDILGGGGGAAGGGGPGMGGGGGDPGADPGAEDTGTSWTTYAYVAAALILVGIAVLVLV